MRKFFTTLKSVVAIALVAAMTLSVSCSYDDTAIKGRVDKVEKDLAALTERVKALEDSLKQEVPTLEELLDGKSVVVNVTTDANGNTILELSNGKTVTVLGPCDHECQPCDCDTLQYRVVDGVLEVSADGVNWIAVNGVTADQVVVDVQISEDGRTATIVLADGQEFTLVKAELIECSATRSQLYVTPDSSREIIFTVNDAVVDINIMNQPLGWKAAIDVAPAAEDDVHPGMGILAAGGTDFLLKITGPASEFVKAGYAEKEGFVSIHFNTAAGACKVAKVLVNLAELNLDVDAQGNITLTNSVANAAGVDEMGNPMYDFANYYVGVVAAEDYEQYGDRVFAETFDDWTYEYTANVASTQRTSGFQNVVDLQLYEAGVCEKEVYTFTVDQLAKMFWPAYTFEMGKEYIIFATLDAEVVGYVEQPILTNAAKDSYKRVFVNAEYVADSATWNDASFVFNLAGYTNYVVGWMSFAEVEELMSYGLGTSFEEILPQYISGYGLYQGGAIIGSVNATLKLSELAAMSLSGWAPMLNADTEYYFYIYPFNMESEMDLSSHKLVAENIFYGGTFKTKALVAGEFDATAQYEVTKHTMKQINVNVTFGENVKTVAYNWFDATFMDSEEAAAVILADQYGTEFVTFNEEVTYVAAEKYDYYGLSNPVYLGMLAINEAGEYVYVEKPFELEPAPKVEVTSFEYLGRSYDFDEDPDTSGGDYVYLMKGTDGKEFTLAVYYTYANEDGSLKEGTLEYITNNMNSMYSYWSGFSIVAEEYYSDSKLVVTAETITLQLVVDGAAAADYVWTIGGGDPEPPVVEDSFTYLGRYLDLDDDPETSGGDYVYQVVAGGVEYKLGLYHEFVKEDGAIITGTYSYCYNVLNVMYSSWCGFVIEADTYYHGSTLTATAEGVTLRLLDVNGDLIGEYFYEGVPTFVDAGGEYELNVYTHSTSYSGSNEHEINFSCDELSVAFYIDFAANPITAGTYSLEAGTLIGKYCKSEGKKMTYCEVVVTDNGDGTLTLDGRFSVDDKNYYHFVYTAKFYA